MKVAVKIGIGLASVSAIGGVAYYLIWSKLNYRSIDWGSRTVVLSNGKTYSMDQGPIGVSGEYFKVFVHNVISDSGEILKKKAVYSKFELGPIRIQRMLAIDPKDEDQVQNIFLK